MNLRRFVVLGTAGAALGTLAVLGAACGNSASHHTTTTVTPDTSSTEVTVQLSNWAIKASPGQVQAGIIRFVATHEMDHTMMDGSQGGETHDLDVARKSSDGSFKMMGSVKDIGMGESKALYLTLEPGEYELQCNVVEQVDGNTISHYAKGMHETFTVT